MTHPRNFFRAKPKNLRYTYPRNCEFCEALWNNQAGTMLCLCPDGPEFDVGDAKFRVMVCDRFKRKQ